MGQAHGKKFQFTQKALTKEEAEDAFLRKNKADFRAVSFHDMNGQGRTKDFKILFHRGDTVPRGALTETQIRPKNRGMVSNIKPPSIGIYAKGMMETLGTACSKANGGSVSVKELRGMDFFDTAFLLDMVDEKEKTPDQIALGSGADLIYSELLRLAQERRDNWAKVRAEAYALAEMGGEVDLGGEA